MECALSIHVLQGSWFAIAADKLEFCFTRLFAVFRSLQIAMHVERTHALARWRKLAQFPSFRPDRQNVMGNLKGVYVPGLERAVKQL